MTGHPVLLVVYDFGSLAPTRIAEAAAANGCDVVFVVADSEHTRQIRPILTMVGSVVELTDPGDGALVDRLRGLQPAGIVTFSELCIGHTARLADALGLPNHAVADIDVITTKSAQRARLAETGVETVAHHVVTDRAGIEAATSAVPFPAIVKPVVGASSRNTELVSSPQECRAVLDRTLGGATPGPADLREKAVIVEEFLAGRPTGWPWADYIAVDCVATGDIVRPLFVSSRFQLAQPFRERGGYGGQSVVDDSELAVITKLACEAIHAVNIRHGVAQAELKLTVDGPRVIEVNGRLGGWVDDLAVRSGGADPADVAVKCALGLDFDLHPPPADGPIPFQYIVIPPAGADRVTAIKDAGVLRRIDHVERVSVLTSPGASADWRLGTRSKVAAVFGTTRTLADLADTITEIEQADWIDYA
ncbi:acetyl-CoA carboxylase biotin carboxylase subunit family protein [Amycolatopsis sp. NPDC051758]|uniref:acetyl-CoA carboxylase biotin carboxylase subunit family protein n=1 Tax=Amycolatopsis sp. NPDC051758 TaxID=3363935 RepID=UPI0037881D49